VNTGDAPWIPRLQVAHLPLNSVLQRQTAFAAIFGISVGALPLVVGHLDAPVLVGAAVLVEVAVLMAAAFLPWGRWVPAAQDLLPVASVVALLLLQRGTSAELLYFSILVLLPVSTLAWTSGRRGVLIGTALATISVLAPAVWIDDFAGTGVAVYRGILVPLVAFVLAVFVADAGQGLRTHAATQSALADQLRTSRDLMAGLVEAATEQAIVATDVAGIIEVFNKGAEQLSGRSAPEMIGRSILDLGVSAELDAAALEQGHRIPPGPEGDPQRWSVLVGSAAHGLAFQHDWTLVGRERTRVVRLTVTRRTPLPGDEEQGYLLVATDVTAERESERAKDEFLGYVSHELRTPISSVLGYLELLRLDDDDLSAEQRGYLEVIERNAQRLLHLVEDLLLRAQVDAGGFVVRQEPTDLADVLAAAVRSAVPFAISQDLALVDSTPGPVALSADPVRLGQMVDNLLSNALKFTPAGGRVEVRAVRSQAPDGAPQAVLTVQDDGVGIPADEVHRLTDRFFRATTATRHRVPGVGLGLSITQAIVDAHGGELAISSVEGAGTTFTVTLPSGSGPAAEPV
jgi:signal transduction histidine kinase